MCVCVCDFKGGVVVGVETTHKASNKSLFFPLVLSRESFPFPHKKKEEKKIREKKVCTCRLGFMVSTKPKEKKMKEKKKTTFLLPVCVYYRDIK